MSDDTPVIAKLVVSSLKAQPPRPASLLTIILPAPWLLQRIYGGVWISGDALLTEEALRFVPSALPAKLRREKLDWSVPLTDISEVVYQQGLVMDTLQVHHARGSEKMKCIRASAFVEQLEAARAAAV